MSSERRGWLQNVTCNGFLTCQYVETTGLGVIGSRGWNVTRLFAFQLGPVETLSVEARNAWR